MSIKFVERVDADEESCIASEGTFSDSPNGVEVEEPSGLALSTDCFGGSEVIFAEVAVLRAGNTRFIGEYESGHAGETLLFRASGALADLSLVGYRVNAHAVLFAAGGIDVFSECRTFGVGGRACRHCVLLTQLSLFVEEHLQIAVALAAASLYVENSEFGAVRH